MLSSCSCNQPGSLEFRAAQHEEKLKQHFSGHYVGSDLSSLMRETKSLANQLREAGMEKKARKFESYTDVLMFGNNTLDESIKDVKCLVKGSKNSKCKVISLCELKKKIFGGMMD